MHAMARTIRTIHSAPTVLVIEDNDVVRDSLVILLQAAGYSTTAARNGDHALALLHQGLEPCLILLDLMMPVKSGWEFRAEQLKDPALAHIPTAVLSSEDAARNLRGIVASLPKPIDVDQLLAVVQRHC
jgi:CheY-like chemotaxis protein